MRFCTSLLNESQAAESYGGPLVNLRTPELHAFVAESTYGVQAPVADAPCEGSADWCCCHHLHAKNATAAITTSLMSLLMAQGYALSSACGSNRQTPHAFARRRKPRVERGRCERRHRRLAHAERLRTFGRHDV